MSAALAEVGRILAADLLDLMSGGSLSGVVDPGSGEVFMASVGLSPENVNPQLIDRLPQLNTPVLVNASMAAFVDLSWRWFGSVVS